MQDLVVLIFVVLFVLFDMGETCATHCPPYPPQSRRTIETYLVSNFHITFLFLNI